MAFTSIRNEPCRIEKELQQSTGAGRYMLGAPGPGANVGFAEDPHIRLQGWGANLRTNTINTESDLLGLTRPLTKDCKDKNQYNEMSVNNEKLTYGTIQPSTEEPRAIMPPWTTKDARIERWNYLHFDPQAHIESESVRGGTSTRIENKNEYNIHCSYLRN